MPKPTPNTPEWWRDRLLVRYVNDYDERVLHGAMYESTAPNPESAPGTKEVYRRLLNMARTPWGRLVVDIVAERMSMQGISVKNDDSLGTEVWDLFRRNRIEAVQRQVHREAVALGTSYVSVWSSNESRLDADMAFESALSMTHENASGSSTEVAAACKIWFDSIEGVIRYNLYLDNVIYKWESGSSHTASTWRTSLGTGSGEAVSVRWDELEVVEHSDGMPITPFVTRPDWEGYGTSDLKDLIAPIQRIEALTASTLLAVELGAFRQKWATGIELPVDEAGQPIEKYKVAYDRLWVSEDPGSKFGAFDSTDIRPYLQAISDAVGQLSAVSRIPTLYFNQSELSNPPSAASLEASETGLINRVRERRDRFSESWEQVAEQVIRVSGLQADLSVPIDIVWKDPRTRSESQVLDAAVKLYGLETPWESVMEFIGYTKTEIADMKAKRAADTFDRLLRDRASLPRATNVETTQQAPADSALPDATT